MTSDETKVAPLGMRHVQSLLIFFAMIATYLCRWSVSVSVVAMTNAHTANPNFPEFDWNEKQISYIHSSFFWGYILTQYPGGVLCKRYGAKIVMLCSVLFTALLSALTPVCVNMWSWQAFCAIRVLQGLSQGLIYPSVFDHLAKWSPVQELNRLGGFALSGMDCGTVVAMGISGIIAKGPLGWPGIFYVSAGFSIIWCPLWFIFASNSPSQAKFISVVEKHYIETSLGQKNEEPTHKIPTPWRAVFTSIPFLVFFVARCSQLWGLSTFAAQIPAYFNGVLNMEIRSNALFSALPFLVSWLMTYVFMALSDVFQQRNVMSLGALRNMFTAIGFITPAAGLIAMGFLDENNKNLALSLMTISVGATSADLIGSSLNIIELTPNHTAVLFAVVNTLSNLMPLISPLVVGVIVTDMHNRLQWQIVFAITAVIYILGTLLYVIFSTTEIQPWDAEDYLTAKDEECSKSVVENKEL